MAKTQYPTTPPAQLRLKDASSMHAASASPSGVAAAQLYRASCPVRLFDHPIRRGDGDGKQDRGEVFCKEKKR